MTRFEELSPPRSRDIPTQLATDLKNLNLDVRVDVCPVTHDQDLARDAPTIKVTIHSKGATETQFAHESRTFAEKARDLP